MEKHTMWKTAGPRLTASCIVLALAAPAALRADERTVFCESRNYRYHYCRVDTDNRASLISQRSPLAKCELGRSWGYDARGVWVDRGCAAEFRVGRGGGNTAAAAGAAALVGAAIAASIIASRNNDKHRDELPSWAVGNFRGFDPRERTDIEIRVSPSGTIDGYADNSRFSGRWTDGRLDLGKFRFDLRRTNRGFQAVDVNDRSHEIDFTPAGWNQ